MNKRNSLIDNCFFDTDCLSGFLKINNIKLLFYLFEKYMLRNQFIQNL